MVLDSARTFTFQYVSINTDLVPFYLDEVLPFTFQYVSINTGTTHSRSSCKHWPLHSNMFLLIRNLLLMSKSNSLTLHSNMFLLIQRMSFWEKQDHFPLHSNMFLLIPEPPYWWLQSPYFTFQYVSINTNTLYRCQGDETYFTFQYVSINTSEALLPLLLVYSLHSNMFLLIR